MPVQAHEHAHELYRACPRWCLDWGTRGPGILAEIRHWDPDIGCLQEVDRLEQVQAHLEAQGCGPPPSQRCADAYMHGSPITSCRAPCVAVLYGRCCSMSSCPISRWIRRRKTTPAGMRRRMRRARATARTAA